MHRFLIAMTVFCFLAPAATADYLIVKGKRKGKITFVGIKDKIDGVVLNLANAEAFADQSTGVIVREGYDGIEIKKKAKDKSPVFYSSDRIIKRFFTTEPASLLDGFDQKALGAYPQAIGFFRQVASDGAIQPVHRAEANYQIGWCYLLAGNRNGALAHFARWQPSKSVYTPEAFRLSGVLQIARKKYKSARDFFNKILALPDITAKWKFKARLGLVSVDIAERKFDVAEKAAKKVAMQIGVKDELSGPLALAMTLQAKAILRAGNKDRLPEAQTMLERAAKLKSGTTTRADLFATLGDVIYAQGNPDEARYAYMRVPTLYRSESGFAAHALRNAGQCFLDLCDRTEGNDKLKDELLVKGMQLLGECARRYRGRAPAREAATVYRQRKADYEAAKTRIASGS